MIITGSKSLISPGAQFPYESSWLIYIKILQWNRIRDFKHLMDFLNSTDSTQKRNLDWWNSSTDHLNMLGSALGREVDDLKYSFVDGWFPLPDLSTSSHIDCRGRVSIRHCPECVAHGYHSVIFYFDRITHCPWHHLVLEPCDACTSMLTKYWPVGEGIYKAAESCEHLNRILDITAPKEMSSDLYSDVKRWVDSFKLFAQKSVSLLGDIAYNAIASNRLATINQALIIDFLVQKFGFYGFDIERPRKIRMMLDSRPSSIVIFPGAPDRSQLSIGLMEIRPMIKAIRRYIFRRHLRHHRKCFARMNCLHRSAWYMLDINAICPCVLAYFLVTAKFWMVPPYDVLASRSTIDVAQFWLRDENGFSKTRGEFQRDVVSMLGKFYELWVTLRNCGKLDFQCVPFVDQYFNVVWNLNPVFYYSGRGRPFSPNLNKYFFMEDPQDALDASQGSCSSRRQLPLYIDVYFKRMMSFVNAPNVYCVIYNLSASKSGCCDVQI